MERPASRLRRVLLLVIVVPLTWGAYLLATDPSDTSYDCPGSTWSLLRRPAPPGPGFAPDFFDAGDACNKAARAHTRTAATVLLAGLSAAAVVTLAEPLGRRARRRA